MKLLPIGYSDFKTIIDKGFRYVDKTLFIKELLDSPAQVTLLLRPRRFGKTLLLSMLRYFFDKTKNPQEYKYLFDELKIMQAGEKYVQYQGQHPVISITLKDIKSKTFEEAYAGLCNIVRELYLEHSYLLNSNKLYDSEKETYELILNEKAAASKIKTSIKDLAAYMSRHHGINPIILIDEYDTPIQASYTYGYYSEMIDVMRGFYSNALKDNIYLEKAVLTGILKVAKENIFSGLNNLVTYSLLDTEYSEYFGFTEPEVTELLDQFGLNEKADEIREWYNGYQFGETIIYNPWSIINCINSRGELKPYWVNTSSNDLIKDLIANSTKDFGIDFKQLLIGLEMQEYISPNIVFNQLQENETAVWTLLLMSGYLKSTACSQHRNRLVCSLKIPNKEVTCLYDDIIQSWVFERKNLQWYNQFLDCLRHGDIKAFSRGLQELVLDMFSYHDVPSQSQQRKAENFYHGFAMGLIVSLRDEYYIESNKESGFGRYDLAIIPKSQTGKNPAIIFEFKSAADDTDKTLQKTAQAALDQIEIKCYETAIQKFNPVSIIKVGIAFSGKNVCVVSQ